jgi:ribosomal protein S18 acetylase RimI-like enzyme
MRRAHLRDLPPVELPLGYRLRTAGEGDVPGLSTLLTAAFAEEWDVSRVRRNLFDDPGVVTIYLIEDGDRRIVATASSRIVPQQYPGSGYLHWVGADPDESGRRLGYWVTLAVLHDFSSRGLVDSVLETDDWRIPAITTYLKCGYVPEPREPADVERWNKVRAAFRPGSILWPQS